MSDLSLKNTFNSDVEHYHARRPHYPAALFDKLIADTQLPKNAELLEIGPGTGQATRPLAELGYRITAVELGEKLASKAREVLKNYPNVEVITGAFEEVELPPEQYDLVYSATAIHWIKPEYKFTKPHALLKPDGYLAIIHAEHISDEAGDTFFFAGQPIYHKYHTKNKALTEPPKLKDLRPSEEIDEALFAFQSFTVFPMIVQYSSQEYVDLIATYSPNLALPNDKRKAFLNDIKALIDKDFQGRINKHYGMALTIAKKRS